MTDAYLRPCAYERTLAEKRTEEWDNAVQKARDVLRELGMLADEYGWVEYSEHGRPLDGAEAVEGWLEGLDEFTDVLVNKSLVREARETAKS